MNDQPVIARVENGVGRLILNRPGALHALNLEMCQLMTKALLEWWDEPGVNLVLVDHLEGTRGFCAGGDVRALAESAAGDGRVATQFFRDEYRLNALIQSYPKPYVAVIDGVTMGGGVGISVHGSHRIATEKTVFAMPEAGIGLFPDVGGSWFLPRLAGGLGAWLAMTGTRLKARDVLACGVATHFADSEKLPKIKADLQRDGIAALDGLEDQAEASFSAQLPLIDACFAKETVEEILDALMACKGSWAAQQAEIIGRQSPTTLKVTERQLKEGALHKSFAQAMRMEFRIAMRVVRGHDFSEGVRALIIDKDQKPKWDPAELSGVSTEMIEKIFAPLEGGELKLIGED